MRYIYGCGCRSSSPFSCVVHCLLARDFSANNIEELAFFQMSFLPPKNQRMESPPVFTTVGASCRVHPQLLSMLPLLILSKRSVAKAIPQLQRSRHLLEKSAGHYSSTKCFLFFYSTFPVFGWSSRVFPLRDRKGEEVQRQLQRHRILLL